MVKRFSFFIFIFLISSLLFAEKIIFKADSMIGKSGSKTDETKLTGNAYVKTDTIEVSADEIILSGDDFRFIEGLGNVSGKNRESGLDFTCGTMKYDRNTEIAKLEDSVHLIDVKNNVVADAQIVEYDQKTDIAILQMNVNMKQKNNVCTSAYAVYRKKSQMLEMSGNPKIVQDGDTFRAQEITLNLDTQEITLDGRVQGSVTDSGDKKKSEKETKTDEKSEAKNDG